MNALLSIAIQSSVFDIVFIFTLYLLSSRGGYGLIWHDVILDVRGGGHLGRHLELRLSDPHLECLPKYF